MSAEPSIPHAVRARRILGAMYACMARDEAGDLAGAIDSIRKALSEFGADPSFAADNPAVLADLIQPLQRVAATCPAAADLLMSAIDLRQSLGIAP